MRSIRFRLMVAALAVLFATAIAHAQTADAPPADAPPPPQRVHAHEFGFGGHMMGFFADYLNLTDAQQAQMKSIMQKEHPTLKPLMQQLHETHAQLKQFEESAYDEAKVRALATQEAQANVELTVQKTRIHNELFQVLTADQQAKMKEFEARRAARMQKHMHSAPPAPENNQE
jgi:Spy/CpxP family protein refolding chaperone